MSRLKITKEFWKLLLTEIKEDKPKCAKCNKELVTGDFVDHLYPYEQENNICRKCILKGNRNEVY